ncbi:MAG: M35 family metallo-endopeptidase [Cyanobacteria bacterium J06560_6]
MRMQYENDFDRAVASLLRADATDVFDYAETPEALPCITPGNPYILHCFPVHKTDLTALHHEHLDRIADKIVRSFRETRPIKKVKIVGHAATWKNISQAEYGRRALVRAENAKAQLIERLAIAKVSDKVAIAIEHRANRKPLVDNLVTSPTQAAQNNRAINRRVEFFFSRSQRRSPSKPSKLTPPNIKRPKPHSYQPPKFKDSRKGRWTSVEKNRVKNAYPIAIDMVVEGKRIIDAIAATPGANARKAKWDKSAAKQWFGEFSERRLRRVRTFLNTALKRLKTKQLIFVRRGVHKRYPNANAATSWNSRRIHIYDPFFKQKDATYYCSSIGSVTITWKVLAASIIVHEVMHQSRLTRSDTYGKAALALAKRKPNNAVNNAENYQLFAAEAYVKATASPSSSAWYNCWMDIFINYPYN